MSPDATTFDDVLLSLDKVAALIVLEAVERYSPPSACLSDSSAASRCFQATI